MPGLPSSGHTSELERLADMLSQEPYSDGSTYNDYWADIIDDGPSLCPVIGCNKESGDINGPYCGEAHMRMCEDEADWYTGPTYRECDDESW